MTAQAEEATVPAAPQAPPMDEGVDLLNQAFADAAGRGLVVLAAKIAGGTARILGQNQTIAQLSAHQSQLELERVKMRQEVLDLRDKVANLEERLGTNSLNSAPANDVTPEAPPG
jgi:predicted nuclease with TOPRIM domain